MLRRDVARHLPGLACIGSFRNCPNLLAPIGVLPPSVVWGRASLYQSKIATNSRRNDWRRSGTGGRRGGFRILTLSHRWDDLIMRRSPAEPSSPTPSISPLPGA